MRFLTKREGRPSDWYDPKSTIILRIMTKKKGTGAEPHRVLSQEIGTGDGRGGSPTKLRGSRTEESLENPVRLQI